MLAFQVTVKLVPVLLSGPGWARILPLELTMVISLSGKEEIVPDVVPALTAAPATVQVPKLVSGDNLPVELAGRSAIHSALVSWQVVKAQVWVVLRLLPEVVESVSFSV